MVVKMSGMIKSQLPLANTSSAVWQSISKIAVLNNVSRADTVAVVTGNTFLPKTPEAFTYDADGNLASDGRWTYAWDAENRLINMTSIAGPPTASLRKLDFVYDYLGRWIQKTAYTNSGSVYVAQYTNKFVYDGWNLVAVLNPA